MAAVLTKAGMAGVASRIIVDTDPAIFNYVAVGIGTTAATSDDTTLESEITDSGMARATGTLSLVTTTETDDTAQCVKSFTVTGTKAVTEQGWLNAAAAGTLLLREVFAAINVVNGYTLVITNKAKVSA
jgi:hypothetical protein